MAKKDSKKPEKPADEMGSEKIDKKAKSDKKAPADKKDKKDKKNKKGGDPAANGAGGQTTPLANMSPEQMTMAQIEQSLKESTDPEARLKKLRSPVNVRSCLLNVLFLIVMTLAIVIIWCVVAVDKFNFVTVVKDMSSQFGITQGFQWLWSQISGWFH
ncbi:MAG: hypothetical protein J1G04_02900 [Clostridiales bacterium]|nr:hypothetical protein [Clostridiales bacterium]